MTFSEDRTFMNLRQFFLERHGGDPARFGPSPKRCWRYQYYSPDLHYEHTVASLITPETAWLDVGGGRDVFPHYPALERTLAARAKLLVGVDPSPNILENPVVHERVQSLLEEYETNYRFTLATLRMVAEHIANPERFAASLERLVAPGGRVVIYTVNKFAPIAVVSALTPLGVHHAVKRVLWNTEERDTFPVHYLINTRGAIRSLFVKHGFAEERFEFLADCRTTTQWAVLHTCEIVLSKLFQSVGLCYPENCLLGIYRRM